MLAGDDWSLSPITERGQWYLPQAESKADIVSHQESLPSLHPIYHSTVCHSSQIGEAGCSLGSTEQNPNHSLNNIFSI